jgi:hypothetical protein
VASIGQWGSGSRIIVQFWGRKRGAIVAIGSMESMDSFRSERRIGKAKHFPIFMRMSEERCGSEEGV